MNLLVIKRDGREVPFDESRIVSACKRAFDASDGELFVEKIVSDVKHKLKDCEKITVEEIQDKVEEALMKYKYFKTAKSYIKYREKRNIQRSKRDETMNLIREKLNATNVQNQNANIDERTFSGRLGEADSILVKNLALNEVVSEKTKQNHLNNRIYIHDLDRFLIGMQNCLSIPFDDLLKNGFITRQADVRPANSISTAFQLVAVLFQLQSQNQYGGVAATHLDWTMVPYVRKSFVKHWRDGYHYIAGCQDELDWKYLEIFDIYSKHFTEKYPKVFKYALDMTEKDLRQAVEGMYHNLNTLQSRSGGQVPFTSINYGTCTLPEGRMVIKALIEGSIKGVGKLHKTPIFPCGIFTYQKDINDRPGTPNYDLFQLAIKSTAKRLYPNYSNGSCSIQEGWVKYDRKLKQDIINNLSEKDYSALYERLVEKPELRSSMMLDIDENNRKLVVIQDLLPIEIASTMGKQMLQLM